MADLITSDTIITLLGDDAADEDVLNIYIEFAVGEIEAYLGRPVSIQEFEETIFPDVDGKAYLMNTPVVSVSSVDYAGDVIDPDLYTTTPWGLEDLYYVGRAGYVVEWDPLEGYPGFQDPVVTVAYSAGLDTPSAVNSVIAAGVIRKYRERAAQINQDLDGSGGLKEVRVEDYQYKFQDDTVGLYGAGGNNVLIYRSEQDFLPIKRYKRRGFA